MYENFDHTHHLINLDYDSLVIVGFNYFLPFKVLREDPYMHVKDFFFLFFKKNFVLHLGFKTSLMNHFDTFVLFFFKGQGKCMT